MISNVWRERIVRESATMLITGMLVLFSPSAMASEEACAETVGRIVALHGTSQTKALRSLLAGGFLDDHESLGCLFSYGDQLLRPLRALLPDAKFGKLALPVLFLIGDPKALTLVRSSNRHSDNNRWAYSVVCSMLEPASPEDWMFLRKAAFNEFSDRWVDYGAIQTLKLIASPRSQKILEESAQRNPERAKALASAIAYIQSNPRPLVGENLEELAERTAKAVRVGEWEGNGPPQFNQAHNKAIVDFAFNTGSDSLTYTATFYEIAGVWKLRGVQETLQAMLPPPILLTPRPAPPLLPIPPDLPFDPTAMPPLFPLLQGKDPGHPLLFHQCG
jgi:hypothetical protein